MTVRFSRQRRVLEIIAIVLVTSGIGTIHYFTPDELFSVHYVLQRLFYAPVVYAGVRFGWKGGLSAGLFSGLSYLPQIVAFWRIDPRFSVNQYVEVLLFCLVGVVTGVLATREQKHKQALRQSAEELRQVYAELQTNFENMKRAERLYALGQLSAGLAHEIRNPLAGIEGAASILLREPASIERRTEFLQIIQKECHRLNRLLASFLDFAKPAPPTYQLASIEPLLESVFELTKNAVGRRPFSFQKEIPPNFPMLQCDPGQLTQVLLNLTINAVQAMPEGGLILISALAQRSQMIIRVSDQGVGVVETNLERIFDPFFTTKESGTGLGLAVAHQIILNHGGKLTASRNPSGGMTFTIQMPVTRSL